MKKIILFSLVAITFPLFCCSGGTVNKSGEDDPWKWNDKNNPETTDDTEYYPKAATSFRIVSYNVGAFSKFMSNSTSMIADMLTEVKADVVALNELDSCNTRHNVNQAEALAKYMGWQWYFGRAMSYRDGAYGNGIILPAGVKVIRKYTVPLSKGSGSEPRSIAVVETDKYVIGGAHLDYTTEEAALTQVKEVNEWAEKNYKNYGKPVFFCGDMNSVPDSKPITNLKAKWTVLSSVEPTIPCSAPKKCIDYIFVLKGSATVSKVSAHTMMKFKKGDVEKASDHLPIYADVKF